jgi:hypothetical protein
LVTSYIQHSNHIEPGREGLFNLIKSLPPTLKYEAGLAVNGEKVEGWMDAMTMSYPVEKPEILKKIKVGDTIMATVYKGETTLHDVMVMPPGKQDKQKSK